MRACERRVSSSPSPFRSSQSGRSHLTTVYPKIKKVDLTFPHTRNYSKYVDCKGRGNVQTKYRMCNWRCSGKEYQTRTDQTHPVDGFFVSTSLQRECKVHIVSLKSLKDPSKSFLPPKQTPKDKAHISGAIGKLSVGWVPSDVTTRTIMVVRGTLSTNADVIPETCGHRYCITTFHFFFLKKKPWSTVRGLFISPVSWVRLKILELAQSISQARKNYLKPATHSALVNRSACMPTLSKPVWKTMSGLYNRRSWQYLPTPWVSKPQPGDRSHPPSG